MKMILLVYNVALEGEVQDFLAAQGIDAYTKWPMIVGRGQSGPRLDTHIWPGANDAMAIALDDEKAARTMQALRQLRRQVRSVGLKAFLFPLEDVTADDPLPDEDEEEEGEKTDAAGIHGVVFDFDGVLVDTEPLHVKAWRQVFEPRGLFLTDEDFRLVVGKADLQFLEELVARGKIAGDPTELQAAKREVYLEILRQEGRPISGGIRLVRELEKQFRLGIASSGWHRSIETGLKAVGLDGVFQVVVSKDDVENHKPNAEPYERAAEGLGLTPGECVAIEDSPIGVASAKAAGLRCLAVTNSFSSDELSEADLTLPDLTDLIRIMQFLQSGK